MMNKQKFSHFEIFKIAVNTVYIASGVWVFSIWLANVITHFGS